MAGWITQPAERASAQTGFRGDGVVGGGGGRPIGTKDPNRLLSTLSEIARLWDNVRWPPLWRPRREALMGKKDKGVKSSKTAPSRSLKEKRLDKKAKRAAHTSDANESVDRAFGRR